MVLACWWCLNHVRFDVILGSFPDGVDSMVEWFLFFFCQMSMTSKTIINLIPLCMSSTPNI